MDTFMPGGSQVKTYFPMYGPAVCHLAVVWVLYSLVFRLQYVGAPLVHNGEYYINTYMA